MKKTLLRRGAIVAACAAVFVLGSCGDTEFDGRQDTVYQLETPSVTAKAYPGVNFVSWKPVTGANGYKVTVYEEGVFKRDVTEDVSDNSYSDIILTNGKNYTYYVEAVSATNPAAKAVYATNSRGEASARAIVPPAGTKSLELPAYEGGYDGTNTKTVPESDNWVVKPGNITVAVANGKVSVNFPMKAYLTYGIKVYNYDKKLPHELVYTDASKNGEFKAGLSDKNANNVLGLRSFDIEDAGSYQIAVKAFSLNGDYADSDEVIYGELIKIEKLDLDFETTAATAEYVLNDNKFVTGADKTARVVFTPAMLDDKYVSTDWYTVYRRVKGEYTNTEVATVKESTDTTNGTKYYVDDTVPDVTKDYVYTIVVADGKKYGKAETATLSRKTKGDITGLTPDVHFDDTNNKVTLSVAVTGIAASVTPTTAKYLVVPTNRVNPVLAQEILDEGTAVTLSVVADSAPKTYQTEISTPNFTGDDAYVYLVVQATLDGYNTTNAIDFTRIYK